MTGSVFEKINDILEEIALDIVEHEDVFIDIFALLKLLVNRINNIENTDMRSAMLGVSVLYLVRELSIRPSDKVYILEAIKQKYLMERLSLSNSFSETVFRIVKNMEENR